MTMTIFRQLGAKLAEGEQLSLAGTVRLPFRMTDVLPKVKLLVEDGDFASDSITLDASDTATLQLPKNYTSSDRLAFYLKTTERLQVAVVVPGETDSVYVVKATRGTTDGDHKGFLSFQGPVTSITLTAPSGVAVFDVDWFAFKIPDLEDASSYRDGSRTLGVAT